ncbi:MAG: hypothetical protein HZA54_07210 [Planctomycetes bacterium]|nr:hypothetical protein [Planctomycetota bacterium]
MAQKPPAPQEENFWQRMDRLSSGAEANPRDWEREIPAATERSHTLTPAGFFAKWLGRLGLAILPLGTLLGVGFYVFRPELSVTPDGRNHVDWQSMSYVARRATGSATTLTGNVFIVHATALGMGLEAWTNEEMQVRQAAIQKAHQWLQDQAYVYLAKPESGANPEEARAAAARPKSLRIWWEFPALANEMFLRSQWAPSKGLGPEEAKVWGPALAKAMTAATFADAISGGSQRYGTMNHAILFHCKITGAKDRNFPTRYIGQVGTLEGSECCCVYSEPKRDQVAVTAAAIAHAILRVYGAAPLYRVRAGDQYATDDIMQRPPFAIDSRRVSQLTAYAVGWSVNNPGGPFPVVLEH